MRPANQIALLVSCLHWTLLSRNDMLSWFRNKWVASETNPMCHSVWWRASLYGLYELVIIQLLRSEWIGSKIVMTQQCIKQCENMRGRWHVTGCIQSPHRILNVKAKVREIFGCYVTVVRILCLLLQGGQCHRYFTLRFDIGDDSTIVIACSSKVQGQW